MTPKPCLFVRPALLAISVIGLLVFWGNVGGAQDNHVRAETAQHQFKNIRVLKNLPANQLLPTMHMFNASLGVHCDFCHVEGPNHTGFERDDKPAKRMARVMVLMEQDLNRHQKALDNHATCYMCHHGRPTPETKAPMAVD